MAALHLAPLFLSYLCSDAINACLLFPIETSGSLPMRNRGLVLMQCGHSHHSQSREGRPATYGADRTDALYRDVVFPMELARGLWEMRRLAAPVKPVCGFGVSPTHAMQPISSRSQTRRRDTGRRDIAQNGHRHPFRRHQTRLPHLAAAFSWAWQTSQTRSFRSIAAISHTKLGGETLRGAGGPSASLRGLSRMTSIWSLYQLTRGQQRWWVTEPRLGRYPSKDCLAFFPSNLRVQHPLHPCSQLTGEARPQRTASLKSRHLPLLLPPHANLHLPLLNIAMSPTSDSGRSTTIFISSLRPVPLHCRLRRLPTALHLTSTPHLLDTTCCRLTDEQPPPGLWPCLALPVPYLT
ncbi:hypothetical protein LZ30DRAFT_290032 [Colletotrichum cereale]|nr:hypothetical protein LZ30DRAFT_290032 [Colletotrichum cereale]